MPRLFRCRQRIALGPLVAGSLFAVVDGVALVEGLFNRNRPQVVSIVFPGDIVFPKTLPPLAKPSITCLSKRNLVLERTAKAALMTAGGEFVSNEITYAAARTGLQAIILANLTGEERVAALLYEFALRNGRPADTECAFDMPLSRLDMAVYLGLNPDTVSRIVAGLKTDDIIRTVGRSHIRCPNLQALEKRTPVADLLAQMIAQKPAVLPLIA